MRSNILLEGTTEELGFEDSHPDLKEGTHCMGSCPQNLGLYLYPTHNFHTQLHPQQHPRPIAVLLTLQQEGRASKEAGSTHVHEYPHLSREGHGQRGYCRTGATKFASEETEAEPRVTQAQPEDRKSLCCKSKNSC